jgi:nucleoside phosphorylase
MSFESNDYERPPDLNFPLLTLKDIGSKPQKWLSEEIQSQLKSTDILLISDDDAFTACYSYMKQIQRSFSTKLGMVDFGRFGDENVKVALMRRAKGAGETQKSVTNAAGVLCPKVALLVGICETMKSKEAKCGDVAISAKLATYNDTKIRPDGTVEYCGPKPEVSRKMANLNLYAADGWKPPLNEPNSFKVHRQALMLSGSDSITNRKRLEDLKKHFPDALVIEIEGIGR